MGINVGSKFRVSTPKTDAKTTTPGPNSTPQRTGSNSSLQSRVSTSMSNARLSAKSGFKSIGSGIKNSFVGQVMTEGSAMWANDFKNLGFKGTMKQAKADLKELKKEFLQETRVGRFLADGMEGGKLLKKDFDQTLAGQAVNEYGGKMLSAAKEGMTELKTGVKAELQRTGIQQEFTGASNKFKAFGSKAKNEVGNSAVGQAFTQAIGEAQQGWAAIKAEQGPQTNDAKVAAFFSQAKAELKSDLKNAKASDFGYAAQNAWNSATNFVNEKVNEFTKEDVGKEVSAMITEGKGALKNSEFGKAASNALGQGKHIRNDIRKFLED